MPVKSTSQKHGEIMPKTKTELQQELTRTRQALKAAQAEAAQARAEAARTIEAAARLEAAAHSALDTANSFLDHRRQALPEVCTAEGQTHRRHWQSRRPFAPRRH